MNELLVLQDLLKIVLCTSTGRYKNVARTATATQIDNHDAEFVASNAIDGVYSGTLEKYKHFVVNLLILVYFG